MSAACSRSIKEASCSKHEVRLDWQNVSRSLASALGFSLVLVSDWVVCSLLDFPFAHFSRHGQCLLLSNYLILYQFSSFSDIINKNSARPPASWPCFYDFQDLILPLHLVLSNFLVEHIISCRRGKGWIKFIFISRCQIWDSPVKIWRTHFVGKKKKTPQNQPTRIIQESCNLLNHPWICFLFKFLHIWDGGFWKQNLPILPTVGLIISVYSLQCTQS